MKVEREAGWKEARRRCRLSDEAIQMSATPHKKYPVRRAFRLAAEHVAAALSELSLVDKVVLGFQKVMTQSKVEAAVPG